MEREVRVEGHRLIRAPVHRVWQLLSRLEAHPRYATLWLTADLLERSQAAATVEFRGFFGGLPIVSVQRVVLRPPGRIEFKQVRGTLRGLSGAFVLREIDGETDLHGLMAADPGIILFSEASIRQILAGHIDGTLGRIKASAERDLVRVVPRRSQPSGDDGRGRQAAPGPVAHAVGSEAGDLDAEESGDEEQGPVDEAGEMVSDESAAASTEPKRRRRRRRRRRGGPKPSGPAT
jgi:hypothetical protein